ncbi:response regulator [Geobacter sp.]|uniref:response regulator n=1 Tax=Geobacter sp. TaxID=46610 RepID=UPI002610CE58|nr:response regulator [Geobacter sp.]
MKRLLLVDDEPGVLAALRRSLMDDPYEIAVAESGEEGLVQLESFRPMVVISDERMPGMDGSAFLAAVRERRPETVRIMLTGHASVDAAMRAVNGGEIYRFFTKPWDDLELRLALRAAFEKYRLEEENRRLLATVRRQSQELRGLERRFPGITTVERDEQGAFLLPELSEEEIAAEIERCNAI